MKIPKTINVYRRAIMKFLTKKIVTIRKDPSQINPNQIQKILISRPNARLGNLLLLTPLVHEIKNTFPNSKIDLFVKGNIAPTIFQNYENIDLIIQLPKKPFSNIIKYASKWLILRTRQYDLAINAIESSSSGKLSVLFSDAKIKFIGEFNNNLSEKITDYKHQAKYPIYNFRHFLNNDKNNYHISDMPVLDIKLTNSEIEAGKIILRTIARTKDKTIGLFTNATGDKCYSEKWWVDFYDNLKKMFPNVNIIEVLPVENISKLSFKIPNFYTKDIREMSALIANTDVFIAADSGVMHLASAAGTPTIGLFSVTDENIYRPFNKLDKAFNTNMHENQKIFEYIKTILEPDYEQQ